MSAVAHTYARALRAGFTEERAEDFLSFVKELKCVNEALNEKEVKIFFLSPAVAVEQKKQVLEKIFDSFKINVLIRSLLFLLLDRKRWGEKDAVLDCLIDMEKKIQGFVSVKVESARALTSDLREQLMKKLEKVFGKKVSLEEKISSRNLIGGVKIHSGGFVYDDTLLFHLKQMETQIRRNFHDYTGK